MFFLKLLLTPALVIGASAAQRRWGASAGGLLVGLPLTAAPVNLFLALEQGAGFAARAATGTLLGLVPLAGFCVVYACCAARSGVAASSAAGLVAYAMLVTICSRIDLSAAAVFPIVVGSLWLTFVAMRRTPSARLARDLSTGEVALRALAATSLVMAVTGLAQVLGPWLSGLVTPFPVFAGTLAVFTHRSQGADVAASFLRGVVTGSFAYAVFFLVVGTTIEGSGVTLSFCVGFVASVACQAPMMVSPVSHGNRFGSHPERRVL